MQQQTISPPEPLDEPFLTKRQAVEFLRGELGVPMSPSKFHKVTMPSRYEGPVIAAYWGKRPLYTRSGLRAWVLTSLRPAVPDSRGAPASVRKAAAATA